MDIWNQQVRSPKLAQFAPIFVLVEIDRYKIELRRRQLHRKGVANRVATDILGSLLTILPPVIEDRPERETMGGGRDNLVSRWKHRTTASSFSSWGIILPPIHHQPLTGFALRRAK